MKFLHTFWLPVYVRSWDEDAGDVTTNDLRRELRRMADELSDGELYELADAPTDTVRIETEAADG